MTRLGDATALDRIGIRVFQAVRPLARSLSVSQGKGATADAARVSALMESIEHHHAEIAETDSHGPATAEEAAIWSAVPVADDQAAPFDPTRPRGWIAGTDLLSGRPLRVPFGLVSLDYSRPAEADCWPSTNGLASGNSRDEALVAALCELIERDALARWFAMRPSRRAATAIAPATIGDPLGRRLLRRIAAAGLDTTLWDIGTDHGVAAIGCAIVERGAGAALVLPPAFGGGCHPDRGVALSRAITEAAQTRAMMISGARDDLVEASYAAPAERRFRLAWSSGTARGGTRDWARVPSVHHDHVADDAAWLIDRCRALGVPALACVDLTRAEIGVPVVKLIAPRFGDHYRPAG